MLVQAQVRVELELEQAVKLQLVKAQQARELQEQQVRRFTLTTSQPDSRWISDPTIAIAAAAAVSCPL